jgi:hypothetical protein
LSGLAHGEVRANGHLQLWAFRNGSVGARVSAVLEEFTIRIETPGGTESVGEKAAAVDHAMQVTRTITRIETNHSGRSGTIASTFKVRAPSADEAEELALQAFTAALDAAHVESDHGWLIVEVGGP